MLCRRTYAEPWCRQLCGNPWSRRSRLRDALRSKGGWSSSQQSPLNLGEQSLEQNLTTTIHGVDTIQERISLDSSSRMAVPRPRQQACAICPCLFLAIPSREQQASPTLRFPGETRTLIKHFIPQQQHNSNHPPQTCGVFSAPCQTQPNGKASSRSLETSGLWPIFTRDNANDGEMEALGKIMP